MAEPTTDITDEEIDALLAEVSEEIDDGKEKSKITLSGKTSSDEDVNKQSQAKDSLESTASLSKPVAVIDVLSHLETNAGIPETTTKSPSVPQRLIQEKSAALILNKPTPEVVANVSLNSETKHESDIKQAKEPEISKLILLKESQKNDTSGPSGNSVASDVKSPLRKKTSSTGNAGVVINKKPGAAVPVGGAAASVEGTAVPLDGATPHVSEADLDAAVLEALCSAPAPIDTARNASPGVVSPDTKPVSPLTQNTSKSVPTSPGQTVRVVRSKTSSAEELLEAAEGILSDKKIQDRVALKKKNSLTKTMEELEIQRGSVKSSASKAARIDRNRDKLVKSFTSESVAQSPVTPSSTPQSGGWGWSSLSSWSSAVLSSATSLTSQVGGSMYQVLEAVESSLVEPEIVIPSDKIRLRNREPRTSTKKTSQSSESDESVEQELPRVVTTPVVASIDRTSSIDRLHTAGAAKDDSTSDASASSTDLNSDAGLFTGWGSLKGITNVVQKSGKKVFGSGMHVLETISKKTLAIWNTGEEDDTLQEEMIPGMKSLLMKRFDECLGVVHFDALKTLSSMSREKLTTQLDMLSADSLQALKADLELITDAFDLGEMGWELQLSEVDHDFQRLINDFVTRLALSVQADKLITLHESIVNWLESCRREDQDGRNCLPEDVHQMAVQMLAELTANSIALFHKIAQLILVDTCTPALAYKFRALCLAGLTKVVCTEVWIQMRHFTEHINKSQKTESSGEVYSLIQGLTVEASNCSTCLQDAFRLILPIMHLALTRVHPLCLDNSGIPHLEGLQIISRMSALSVRGSSVKCDEALQRHVRDIETQFDLSHLLTGEGHEETDKAIEQDFRACISASLGQLGVEKSTEQIVATQSRIRQWLSDCGKKTEVRTSSSDIHQRAILSLNEFKSSVIEIYHNVAESLLSDPVKGDTATTAESVDYREKADALTTVTRVFCREVGIQSRHFTSCLTATASEKSSETVELRTNEVSSTPFITNIYLEASNSMTCIQDGYQLLLPILQLAVIKQYKQNDGPTKAGAAFKK